MIDHETLGLDRPMQFAKPAAAAPAVSGFSNIYSFGDSLSDAGNNFVMTLGLLPTAAAYSDGRYSNGNTWNQDLAADLHLPALTPSLLGGTDYAFGDAHTGTEVLHALTFLDLPRQLKDFKAANPHPNPNALYTLSVGATDTHDAALEWATNPSEAVTDIQQAVANEISFIGSLASLGAVNFAILDVPDMGKIPVDSAIPGPATALATYYDQLLSQSLPALAAQDHLNIDLVNVFGLIDSAVANPAAYGFTNVTTPVWTGDFLNPLSGTLNAYGAAQNKYLFFDGWHPTAAGHEGIANLALAGLHS